MRVPLDMTIEELSNLLIQRGQPAFRGRQVFSWLHKGKSFLEMKNIPLTVRESMNKEYPANPVSIIRTAVSKLDGTAKFLYGLSDGNIIEGVLMRYTYGCTLCISTQVGCRMGCRFCASTLDGCVRNLTAGEMIGQIVCANGFLEEGSYIGNIVLMGSGEPLDNYDEVLQFLRILREPDGLNIGMRSISLSTCGIVPKMLAFAKEGFPVTLSLSLHAPNDAIRKRIMPIANRYDIDSVLGACKNYIEQTGRRVIIEYALIHDVNAETLHAKELAHKLRGMQCHVNLIPLNAVPERDLKGVSEQEISFFRKVLEDEGISVTRRREMGDDIEGACGQLRRSHLEQNAAENRG